MQMAFDALTEHDDDALIALFANGDQSAARALTTRLAPGVLQLARRMLGDDTEAEDVAQEAMMKLWKIAPDWEAGRARPSTWLYRVTSNLCIDRLRKNRSGRLEDAPEPVDEAPTALAVLTEKDRAAALNAAIATLPDRQKQALQLRHFQDISNIEIAEIMETSVEAIESLLGRARRSLADRLLHRQDELGLT